MQNVIAAAETVLGPDALDNLADALKCSRERFKSPSPRVIAVIELLTATAVLGLTAQDLPPRWTGGRVRTGELRQQFVKIFAPRQPVQVLKSAIGLSADVINERFRADRDSRQFAELCAIAELLRIVKARGGVGAWPARWQPAVHPDNARDLQARLLAVLGPHGSSHMADAAGYSRDYLQQIWRGDASRRGHPVRPSVSLVAMIELIETLEREGVPCERWPERWQRPKAIHHDGAFDQTAAIHAAE